MPVTLGLYDVVVMPTSAAIRCQLETAKPDRYRLQFIDNGIILKERLTSEQSYAWRQVYHLRYDFIRRYGKRTNVFIVEAGRSCETGEGELRFQSTDADKMFNLFRCTTEEILNRQQQHSERGVDVSPGESRNADANISSTDNSNAPAEDGNSLPKSTSSKDQTKDNNSNNDNESSPTLLLRSGSSGPPTKTKDDSHIYSQVQKKRMAPNIPPRGQSLRKPHSNGSVVSVLSSNRSIEQTPVGTVENGKDNLMPSLAFVTSNSSTDKREPIYTELIQTTVSNVTTANGSGNKNRNLNKNRCRSPAPLTDNFIRMEGFTQYATVVDFLPPQSARQVQDKPTPSDSPSQNVNHSQNFQIPAGMSQTSQNEPPMSPVSSANQNKKAKPKEKSERKTKSHNDENKQASSSWFNFFSGGNKKTASS